MVFIMQDFEEKKIDIKSLTLEELKQEIGKNLAKNLDDDINYVALYNKGGKKNG